MALDKLKDQNMERPSASSTNWSSDSDFDLPLPNNSLEPSEVEPVKFKCGMCNVQYEHEKSLKRHLKTCSSKKEDSRRSKCLVTGCDYLFYHKVKMFEHMEQNHAFNVEKEFPGPFTSMQDFYHWKENIEKKTFSAFTKQTCEKKGKYSYYICQFDGSGKPHKSKSMIKTSRKNTKGQTKTDCTCLARICVKVEAPDKIEVTFYKSHNHPLTAESLQYQPLFESDKKMINSKLNEGVPVKKIHQHLRSDIASTMDEGNLPTLERKHFISLKTLSCRNRRLKSEKQHLHHDDAKSVSLKVAELSKRSFDPIFIYKPFGADTVVGDPGIDHLLYPEEIFVLGLQTEIQKDVFCLHAGKVLCIDATHGTNNYKFQLLNFIVRDEFGQGFPVAHVISSRLDKDVICFILKSLLLKFPEACNYLNVIITDDDQALRGAIKEIFGSSIKCLLCWWHLKRSWYKKVQSCLTTDPAMEVFTCLQVILEEKNLHEFGKLSDGFIAKYSTCYPQITDYFKDYLLRKEEWAASYRILPHGDTESNMLVESFHNKLKTFYLERIPNRRIDDLLHLLLTISNDYRTKRNLDLITKPQVIMPHPHKERHQRGMKIPDNFVQRNKESDLIWHIKSQTESSKEYLVKVERKECNQPDYCYSMCLKPECFGLCSHLYHCECPDQIVPCKHIHKIHSLINRGRILRNAITSESHFNCKFFSQASQAPGSGEDSVQKKTINLKQTIESKIKQLQNMIRKNDVPVDVLNSVDDVLSKLLERNIEKSLENIKSLPQPGLDAFKPNEKLKTQALSSFRPAKKKEKSKSGSYYKPKSAEQKIARCSLLSSCLKENKKGPENHVSEAGDQESEHSVELYMQGEVTESVTEHFLNNESLVLTDVTNNMNIACSSATNFEQSLCKLDNPQERECQFNFDVDGGRKVKLIYHKDLTATILTVCGIKLSMIHLKSIDLDLPKDEELQLQEQDHNFKKGWLYDNIIEAYLKKITANEVGILIAPCLSVESMLKSGKVNNPFGKQKISKNISYVIFLYNPGCHWMIFAANMNKSILQFFDPLGKKLTASTLKAGKLICEFFSKNSVEMSTNLQIVQPALQTDIVNCGVYVCWFVEMLMSSHSELNSDPFVYRHKISETLLGSCMKRFSYSDETCLLCRNCSMDINWIQCNSCNAWYHCSCVNIDVKSAKTIDFYCRP